MRSAPAPELHWRALTGPPLTNRFNIVRRVYRATCVWCLVVCVVFSAHGCSAASSVRWRRSDACRVTVGMVLGRLSSGDPCVCFVVGQKLSPRVLFFFYYVIDARSSSR